MKWAAAKKWVRAACDCTQTSYPRNTDMDPAFRGFNLPLNDPCAVCASHVADVSRSATCDAIAPSNDELRRSLSQFSPPPEWFDDNREKQVW